MGYCTLIGAKSYSLVELVETKNKILLNFSWFRQAQPARSLINQLAYNSHKLHNVVLELASEFKDDFGRDKKVKIKNMTEQDFYSLSEIALTKLADRIEKQDVDSIFDVEYADGILNLVIEKTGQTYVINKHSASQKIWYSSPISGADYFSYDVSSDKWLNSKNIDFEKKLFDELSQFMSFSK